MRKKQTREQNSYYNAKQRCTNPSFYRYAEWGGRGIEFRFASFEEFLAEVGYAPENTSIDRINNEGHYEKGNVKWSTHKEQRANRRMTKRNQFGVSGISYFKNRGKENHNFVVRGRVGNTYRHLYFGPDFFLACCARKSFDARYKETQ